MNFMKIIDIIPLKRGEEVLKNKIDLQFLRYDRHNMMNHLQLVSGFLQLKRLDKVEEYVQNLIHILEKERKLIHLNIPEFSYWILMFNHHNHHYRIDYQIDVGFSLQPIDQRLTEDCNNFIEIVKKYFSKDELHHFKINLKERSFSSVDVVFRFNYHDFSQTSFTKDCQRLLNVDELNVSKREQFICKWTYYL